MGLRVCLLDLFLPIQACIVDCVFYSYSISTGHSISYPGTTKVQRSAKHQFKSQDLKCFFRTSAELNSVIFNNLMLLYHIHIHYEICGKSHLSKRIPFRMFKIKIELNKGLSFVVLVWKLNTNILHAKRIYNWRFSELLSPGLSLALDNQMNCRQFRNREDLANVPLFIWQIELNKLAK